MAKINNKSAETYAKPHTMAGKAVRAEDAQKLKTDPNTLTASKMGFNTGVPRVSAGDPASDYVKTDGIEVRGRSKQTKGKLARGPMA
jgi:hypothetical protein